MKELKSREYFPFTLMALAAMLMLASCTKKEEPKGEEQLQPSPELMPEETTEDGDFAGGTGTSTDPYLIANERHLENMMNTTMAMTADTPNAAAT